MRFLVVLSAVLAAAASLAVIVQAIVRAQTGPLPLVSVFELHLLLAAAVLAVVGLLGSLGAGRRRAWTRLAMLAVVVLAVVRGGGELWSPEPAAAAAADGSTMTVLSWNLELGSKAAATSVEGIRALDADLVALQELTPDVARAIQADATLLARYPYRILDARDGTDGMGLLAKRPLIVRGSEREPLILRAGLLLADGRTIEVMDVHPYPPGIGVASRLPVGLDTRRRDEDLGVIGARAASTDAGPAALVVGDLNTAPSEPGFTALRDGLTDAHESAGTGPGFTWRPSSLEGLGLGLLRIDHVLTGAWLTPVTTSVDCSLPGDHCRLLVTLGVAPPGA